VFEHVVEHDVMCGSLLVVGSADDACHSGPEEMDGRRRLVP
jgi:hypothetical protein